MIEDYYGFSSHRPNGTTFGRQRSGQRTERSPKVDSRLFKSPIRSLKRTELSKEKLLSKDSKKALLPQLPELCRNETGREEQSSGANYPASYEEGSSNRRELEMMARKYGHYMKTESVEFVNQEGSSPSGSLYTN